MLFYFMFFFIQVVVKQILRALVYLHARNIAHRDLKPENILYMSKDEDSIIKLCDFGFAKQAATADEILGTPCGTINYAAPEIVDCNYNISVDLWAVGCITYFLLFGIPPFYSEKDDDDEVMDQLMDAKDNPNVIKFPEDAPCSKEGSLALLYVLKKNKNSRFPLFSIAREFILALLNPNSAKRPTATDALQLEWMLRGSQEDEEEEATDEVWEEFRRLRVAELPEDPDERRKRINKILSFVSRGKDDPEDSPAPK